MQNATSLDRKEKGIKEVALSHSRSVWPLCHSQTPHRVLFFSQVGRILHWRAVRARETLRVHHLAAGWDRTQMTLLQEETFS